MIAKCIQDDIGNVAVIFCYAVNGEPPTDVLNTKLSESLCSCIRHHLNYADDEYLLQIAEDGIIRNYSQAEEVVKQLEDQFNTLHSNRTGKPGTAGKGKTNGSQKLTKSPEGEVVTFSTKRGKPDTCSETCGGIYRFKGELYCKYFHNVVGKRDEECIKNEVKGGGRHG